MHLWLSLVSLKKSDCLFLMIMNHQGVTSSKSNTYKSGLTQAFPKKEGGISGVISEWM